MHELPRNAEPQDGTRVTRRSFLQIASLLAGAAAGGATTLTSAASAAPSKPAPALQSGTSSILMDETFAFLVNFDPLAMAASGWDIGELGGAITTSFGNWLKITDTDSQLPVSMTKRFRVATQGCLTWEFRFEPIAAIEGTSWQLLSGGSVAVNLAVSGGQLCAVSPEGPLPLVPVSNGIEYGVKVLANLTQKTFDVYVNGNRLAAAVKFSAAATGGLDGIRVQSGASQSSNMYFGPVRITTGYILNEDFLSVPPATVPNTWTAIGSGTPATIVELRHSRHADNYCLRLTGGSSQASVLTTFSGASVSDIVAEVFFLAGGTREGFTLRFTHRGVELNVALRSDMLSYLDAAGAEIPFHRYAGNVWHHLKAVIRSGTKTADLYVNGKLKATNVALAADESGSGTVSFSVQPNGVAYIDDVRIRPYIGYPADYVPVPRPVSTGDVLVGVQSCSLWREGFHRGWDVINPFRERTPYLGFYDEGDPEVSDWETKWMAENGIGFQIFCWYRPQDGKGHPIKSPRLGHAIHDGLFNSRYGDYTKFMIMWENNGAVSDSADFRQHIVPFWLEHYFKDPRYLLVDNKPVLSIYSIAKLLAHFGSVAGIRAEVDYLDQVLRNAGFAGVLMIGTPTTLTPEMGFAAEYSYTRMGYFTPQTNAMLARRASSAVDVLATISIGREDRPWAGLPGEYATPATFKRLAQWVKEEFIPGAAQGSLARRLVILDNWNEYGEGHFITPSALAGFGYIEAIREVFGTGSAPTNVRPSAAQVRRVTALYPDGRVLPSAASTTPATSTSFTKSWEFSADGDIEGWTDLHGTIASLRAEGGALRGTSTTTDPVVASPDNLGFEAGDHPYVRVRLRLSVPSESELFFTTDREPTFARDKGMTFYAEPGADGVGEIDVPVWRMPKWRGHIKQFRIDPMITTGDFAIEFIKVMHVPWPAPRVEVATAVYPELTVLTRGSTVLVHGVSVLKRLGLRSNWDRVGGVLVTRAGAITASATVGSTTAYRNGTSVTLDVAPERDSYGDMWLPLSFFAQCLGAGTSWDGTTARVDL